MNHNTALETIQLHQSIQRAFSLIEVGFVLVILSVLFIPLVQNMNKGNEVADSLLRDVEVMSASTETIQDALSNRGKKRYLIEKIGRQLLSRGSQGYFIATDFSDASLIPGDTLAPLPRSVFFNQNNELILTQYQQSPPSTVYLKSNTNEFVPLFNYAWQLQNLSSNTNGSSESSTAKGYYLIGAKLKLYDVNSLQATSTLRSVTSLEQLAEFSTNANLKNPTLLQQTQQAADNNLRMPGKNTVMVNFTMDLSEGTCLAPAMKSYNPRNILPAWSTLGLMSQDTGNGRLCSPYLAARNGNWNNGSRNANDYDIYNNDGISQLFWDANDRNQPQTVDANSVAIGQTTQNIAEAFPAGSTLQLLRPDLVANSNFPEGDFDYQGLNAVRCANRYNTAKYDWITSAYTQLNYPFITPPQLNCDVAGQSPQFIKVRGITGNGQFVVEPTRMAISARYSSLLHPTQGDLFGAFEPHEYIAGVELARSTVFMTIFEMIKNTDASTQAHISLSLNNHQGGSYANNTGNLMYPTANSRTVAALYSAPDGKLAEVMRHLYSVNRRTSFEHLTGKSNFDLANALQKLNAYRKQRAVTNCQQAEPNATDCGSVDKQYVHRYYSHFFNIILLTRDATPNNTQLQQIMEDNASGAFSTETTTIFIYPSVHAGMWGPGSLKSRVDDIVQRLKNSGHDAHSYSIGNVASAEYLVKNTIVPMIDNHIIQEVAAENTFYNVERDMESGAYN